MAFADRPDVQRAPPCADAHEAPSSPPVDAVAALFRRGDATKQCPKSTVLFAYFAQWFTDGFLRTDRRRPNGATRDTRRNESTHNVDLAQLYGLNPEMTSALREHEGGRLLSQQINGECYPPYYFEDGHAKREFARLIPPLFADELPLADRQVFAMGTDTRNLGFVAFNVLFLREHNRIAAELTAAHHGWDDDQLFETTRCILIVVLLKLVVEDYINHIVESHFRFRLPVAADFDREPWMRPNWMAIEFNLLYRWHSLVPSTFCIAGKTLTIRDTLSDTESLTSAGLGAFMGAASAQSAGRLTLLNTDTELVAQAETPSILQARAARLDRSTTIGKRFACRRSPTSTRSAPMRRSVRA